MEIDPTESDDDPIKYTINNNNKKEHTNEMTNKELKLNQSSKPLTFNQFQFFANLIEQREHIHSVHVEVLTIDEQGRF